MNFRQYGGVMVLSMTITLLRSFHPSPIYLRNLMSLSEIPLQHRVNIKLQLYHERYEFNSFKRKVNIFLIYIFPFLVYNENRYGSKRI